MALIFRQFETDMVQSWVKTEHEWQNVIRKTEVCSGTVPKDVHLPWCMGFKESKLMCEKYRGQITTITSSEVQKHIFDQLRETANSSVACDWQGVWTGFSDLEVEGHFIDANDGRTLDSLGDFDPFVIGQPNGDTKQNCAFADLELPYDTKAWGDGPCADAIHSFCRMDYNPTLQIRGELDKARESTFNKNY